MGSGGKRTKWPEWIVLWFRGWTFTSPVLLKGKGYCTRMRLKGGILPLGKWWSVSNIAIRLDMQGYTYYASGCPDGWGSAVPHNGKIVKWWDGGGCFSARWGRVQGYGIMLARGKRSVSLLFAPTLNRIWHTCKWKYAFNGWSNWRFNSLDKGLGCVEFVQMILKRHTPENSLHSQQLLSSCRCACVVMNIIEFNEFYLLWRIGFRKGSLDDGGWGWSLGYSRESVH